MHRRDFYVEGSSYTIRDENTKCSGHDAAQQAEKCNSCYMAKTIKERYRAKQSHSIMSKMKEISGRVRSLRAQVASHFKKKSRYCNKQQAKKALMLSSHTREAWHRRIISTVQTSEGRGCCGKDKSSVTRCYMEKHSHTLNQCDVKNC